MAKDHSATVTLRKRAQRKGRMSLYLDYYDGRTVNPITNQPERIRQNIGLYLVTGYTKEDLILNEKTLKLAKEIVKQKEIELQNANIEIVRNGSSSIFNNDLIRNLSHLKLTIREKATSNGKKSLYLDYYTTKGQEIVIDGEKINNRLRLSLGLILELPTSTYLKKQNDKTKEKAKRILMDKQQTLLEIKQRLLEDSCCDVNEELKKLFNVDYSETDCLSTPFHENLENIDSSYTTALNKLDDILGNLL